MEFPSVQPWTNGARQTDQVRLLPRPGGLLTYRAAGAKIVGRAVYFRLLHFNQIAWLVRCRHWGLRPLGSAQAVPISGVP